MKVVSFKELVSSGELSILDMYYILQNICDFQKKDPFFYDAEEAFKAIFSGKAQLFLIDDGGYKGCCITELKRATNGDYYVDVIMCIGEFQDKFKQYISAVRDKAKDVYKQSALAANEQPPLFFKIDGRLGWSKYFNELGMEEMARTFVGMFNYGQ